MSDEQVKETLKKFVENFEKEMDAKMKQMGGTDITWISDPDMASRDMTPRGDCASQSPCDRCKGKIEPCTVQYCHRLHNCASNCQVANDCGVRYCHGRQV